MRRSTSASSSRQRRRRQRRRRVESEGKNRATSATAATLVTTQQLLHNKRSREEEQGNWRENEYSACASQPHTSSQRLTHSPLIHLHSPSVFLLLLLLSSLFSCLSPRLLPTPFFHPLFLLLHCTFHDVSCLHASACVPRFLPSLLCTPLFPVSV